WSKNAAPSCGIRKTVPIDGPKGRLLSHGCNIVNVDMNTVYAQCAMNATHEARLMRHFGLRARRALSISLAISGDPQLCLSVPARRTRSLEGGLSLPHGRW